MFFRRFFRFGLIVILFLGMFGLVRSAAYRSGWSEGFVSGQTADGAAAETAPNAPFNRGPLHGGLGGIFSLFWWGVAAFFKFWFFMFFIGLIFKFLFWGRRGHHGGRPSGPWKGGHWGGWHGHHGHGQAEKGHGYKGHRPPWFDDSDGEPVMKA
jgi:hypothetical protein